MSTHRGMRVVVTGATGNLGTSLVSVLNGADEIDSVLGLARRRPDWSPAKTEWATVELPDESGNLVEQFRGADAVVHLAWQMQPTRNPTVTWEANVLGSASVLRAVAEAAVPVFACASSIGAYSPGPKDRAVDESWPTHGWPTAAYCREKAYVERLLDSFEREQPQIRVIRMRPGFLFKEESASEQRRIFGGHFIPGQLARPELLPFIPDLGVRVQVLHTSDAARAFLLALTSDVSGAFNLAADPPLDAHVLCELFHARAFRLRSAAARSTLATAWGLHLAVVPPQLLDAVLRLPLMDCSRARAELGWEPEYTSVEALQELVRGLRKGAGMDTAPLVGQKVG